jgi:hypothetical protein
MLCYIRETPDGEGEIVLSQDNVEIILHIYVAGNLNLFQYNDLLEFMVFY